MMKNELLLKLADLLDEDAANEEGIKFDFLCWGEISSMDKPVSCGTTACAMGLAALSGAFKDEGLSYKIGGQGDIDFMWKGSQTGGVEAAADLFHIPLSHALFLFTDALGLKQCDGSDAERGVAQRLRRYVELEGSMYNLRAEIDRERYS